MVYKPIRTSFNAHRTKIDIRTSSIFQLCLVSKKHFGTGIGSPTSTNVVGVLVIRFSNP